jgi:hypothetical protein
MVALALLVDWLHRCPGSEKVREPLTVSLWQILSVMDSLGNLKKKLLVSDFGELMSRSNEMAKKGVEMF